VYAGAWARSDPAAMFHAEDGEGQFIDASRGRADAISNYVCNISTCRAADPRARNTTTPFPYTYVKCRDGFTFISGFSTDWAALRIMTAPICGNGSRRSERHTRKPATSSTRSSGHGGNVRRAPADDHAYSKRPTRRDGGDGETPKPRSVLSGSIGPRRRSAGERPD